VCDEPHPLFIKDMLRHCLDNQIDEAFKIVSDLYKLGYSPEDIITNIFRVTKNYSIPEYLKLEFIKEIGLTHMRIAEGVNSLLQLSALVARLCKKTLKPV
jgi:replication factor C subunit 2/4